MKNSPNKGIPYSRVRRKKTKGSSTKGRDKCSSCKATWRQRNWAKRSRAYREDDFATVTEQMNRKARGETVK